MTGLVVGKFYPPHKGHKYLIETALEQTEQLFVVVCSKPDQTITAKLRAGWLREIHPEAEIVTLDQTTFDDSSPYSWAERILKTIKQVPDLLFTSEDYGDEYARLLNATHISVDRQRLNIPVSGSDIRSNPEAYWEYLEPCVRRYFLG